MTDKKQLTGKKERSLNAFWNKHKKGLFIASGILVVVGVSLLALFGIKYNSLERWLKNASLEDLKNARKNIHSEWKQHTINDKYRSSLWDLMKFLDKKISECEWAGETPTGPAYHREHGYNLYKPD